MEINWVAFTVSWLATGFLSGAAYQVVCRDRNPADRYFLRVSFALSFLGILVSLLFIKHGFDKRRKQ